MLQPPSVPPAATSAASSLRRSWQDSRHKTILHKGENRTLWKLGTLPPGLITFYSTTKPLEKSWHVLGLGYNPSISMEEINNATVVHFNGNMKPWLDIGMNQFKPLWKKFVDYELEFVQACNFGA
ncbi:Galacturonosyltransferase 8 [Stylosanthes scabra]|uniref:Hexosyltransferase n=1 Tax=Stylosanthes scabra TaxID=79078 RepID=A0ABU6RPT7_9FABA|nr:Galacturonosyltransferase 8 [Stylosanthes scabra]